ncbi:hypothetical protein PoB_004476000 [Plakobranchus ocellatus]|uniref:Uncharacterized protein n=1 Tax=Plakobranchus ocellatus TaxID=259542 RepID=A0AAV4BGN8_9GAST|nr:hypothetical protein PoB_004476000 [Plakobranchus ocellatus]
MTTIGCVRLEKNRHKYVSALCSSLERYGSAEIASSNSFLIRHGIQRRYFDTDVVRALNVRRRAINPCCKKTNEADKTDCLKSVSSQRVDEFCKKGFPDISFTTLRYKHMQKRKKKCCSKTGQFNRDFSKTPINKFQSLEY